MTNNVFQVPPAFDYLATLTWASSGALVGIRKHFDVVGVFVIALVSALELANLADEVGADIEAVRRSIWSRARLENLRSILSVAPRVTCAWTPTRRVTRV